MAETVHARSRTVAIVGLALQIAATVLTIFLANQLRSIAAVNLAWFLAGGILMWLTVLLVFRQHELAALEAMDLEELRREKEATGGGEALFGEQAGFLVARTRLEWMQRWLLPVMSLFSGVFLVAVGAYNWFVVNRLAGELAEWPALAGNRDVLALGMIAASVAMLLQFFMARYATAMARQEQWQLLRGPGLYTLACSLAGMLFVVALGLALSRGSLWLEQALAWTLPIAQLVLGLETLLLFVADIYRPRAPGVDPRAAFESRLVGVVLLPGGLAQGLSEAVTYQFGFRVDQSWFYRLLQYYVQPLVQVAVVALWLLTSVVIVHPFEHAILYRWGAQVNPDEPWGPGLHLKWPAPFETVQKLNTGQLHSFVVGYRVGDSPDYGRDDFTRRVPVELWTDQRHAGREHYDFLIAAKSPPELEGELRSGDDGSAVHLMRLNVLVQYKIRPEALATFTNNVADVHALIRRLAWNEVIRFNASAGIDELLSARRDELGRVVRTRLAAAADARGIGIDVVHVGVLSAHPETTVAKAFGDVVTARQELIGAVREARVTESQVLSQVAGARDRALSLAEAIDSIGVWRSRRGEAERRTEAEAPAAPALRDAFRQVIDRRAALSAARERAERVREDFEYGFGAGLEVLRAAEDELADDAQQLEALEAAYADALRAAGLADGTRALLEADVALAYWQERLEAALVGLEGDAAVALQEAQAERWRIELTAARELAELENERYAYRAAPELYKAREYLQVLSEGLRKTRKYFKAIRDPERVKLRIEAQEEARPDLIGTRTGN